jgi:hypothetical protein
LDKNLYYSPENLGYSTFGSVDVGSSYEFDIFLVLEKAGKLYYASDSGCSCPTPFEDTLETDLVEITKATLGDLFTTMRHHRPYDYSKSLSSGSFEWDADVLALYQKIELYLSLTGF